jgi:hypothetical protein
MFEDDMERSIAHTIYPLKAQILLRVPTNLTLKNCGQCPQTVLMCSVRI